MTLRRRLDRLEGKRRPDGPAGPLVLFIREAGGEVRAALMVGGDGLARHASESEADFMARAAG